MFVLFVQTLVIAQSFEDVTNAQDFINFESTHAYGSGVSAVDFDKDGDIDLYLLSKENSSNMLDENDGNGNFSIVPGTFPIDNRSRSAGWLDINADGRLDVIVLGDYSSSNLSCLDSNNIFVFIQDENGSFMDISESSRILFDQNVSGVGGGIAAGDINNDGLLDVVMTQWGGRVKLFQNNGDATFRNLTVESGLDMLLKQQFQLS